MIAKAHHGSVSKEQRALIEDDLKRGRLPARGRHQQPRARHRHGRGRPGRPDRVAAERRQRPAAGRPRRPPGRRDQPRRAVPQAPRRPRPDRGRGRADAHRRDRVAAGPGQPARRARPAGRGRHRARRLATSTTSTTWSGAARRSPSCRARAYDATLDLLSGPLPQRRVRRAPPAHRVGPGHRHAHRPARRPAARRHQRRHHPRPRPVRRLPGRRRGPGQAGRRARRGDGLRVPGRRRLRARRDQLADRGHHPRPGAGHPGARHPGPAAVLEGRRPRPPRRARRGDRRLHPRARRAAASDRPTQRARDDGLDEYAAGNLVGYLHEQLEATNVLPSDQHPAGRAVPRRARRLAAGRALPLRHARARALGAGDQRPAARALRRRRPGGRLRRRHRDPDPRHRRRAARRRAWSSSSPTRSRTSSPRRSAARRCSPPGSASARPARCCSPAATPAAARPLWQQRQRSAALLEVAAQYPSFPIVLEAVRECLQDVYDLPALVGADARASSGARSQVVDVATQQPSPYARSLLFGYVAQFVYEGDSPIAERRAAALSLDQGLLAELLGRAELRELLDPEVLAEVEAELQRLAPDRRARDAEGVADLLRLLGPLTHRRGRARARVDGADVAEAGWPTLAATPPRRRGPDRRRGALGRRRGRRPAARRARRRRSRRAPPTPSPTRSRTRSPTWSPATPAPTARSPPTTSPPGSASAPPSSGTRCSGWPPRAGCSTASSGPPASGLGVVRRRGAAPAAPPLAGPAAQGGRAGRAGGARPVPRAPGSTSRRRRSGLRGVDGVLTVDRPARRLPGARRPPWSRWCWPPGCATTSRPTSTS